MQAADRAKEIIEKLDQSKTHYVVDVFEAEGSSKVSGISFIIM